MPRRYWFMQLILLGTVALAVVKAALLNWPALPTTAAWDAVILVREKRCKISGNRH